jgi:glycine/D-amino acid oxidase-like deaminating enzyme
MADAMPDTPLWAATSRERFAGRPLERSLDADVAIVGGGILGLSAALALAQRGRSVAVLEAGAIGDGASGRNNGVVVPAFTRITPDEVVAALGPHFGPALAGLVAGSAAELFALVRRAGIDCDARQTGWLNPAHAAALAPMLRARVAMWRRLGWECEYRDAAETRRMTGSPAFHGAVFVPAGGQINPFAYTNGLARAAAAAGARIFAATPAISAVPAGEGWRLETAGGTVSAGHVLQCTNAMPPGLDPALARSFIPLEGSVFATAPLPAELRASVLPAGAPLSDTRRNLFAAGLDAQGRLIVAGAAIPYGGDAALAARIARKTQAAFPQLGAVQFQRHWRGRLAFHPDFRPRLYGIAPGWWAAIGCQGRGVALGTALGMRLGEALAANDASALPLPLVPPAPIRGRGLRRGLVGPLSVWQEFADRRDALRRW